MKSYFLKILLASAAYFAPIYTIFLAVIVLFVIDWITGVRKSLKNGKAINSYRLRKTINKGVNYIVFIGAAHIVDESLTENYFHLAQIAGAYSGLTEFWSICENLNIDQGKIKELIAKYKK
jgi:phage-related holin